MSNIKKSYLDQESMRNLVLFYHIGPQIFTIVNLVFYFGLYVVPLIYLVIYQNVQMLDEDKNSVIPTGTQYYCHISMSIAMLIQGVIEMAQVRNSG